MTKRTRLAIPREADTPDELDFSDADADDFEALSRDLIPVRSICEADLEHLVRIDSRITGLDRSEYYAEKLHEVLNDSGVRVSLVAEIDGRVAGFVMARVDFGEFGRAEPEAVLDTIGVDHARQRENIALAMLSQLMVNLRTLQVERIRTELDWTQRDILAFFERCGFRPAQQISLEYQVT